jgi:hypothetical protein
MAENQETTPQQDTNVTNENIKKMSTFEEISLGMEERMLHHEKVHKDEPKDYKSKQITVNTIGFLPELVKLGDLTEVEARQLIEQYNTQVKEYNARVQPENALSKQPVAYEDLFPKTNGDS